MQRLEEFKGISPFTVFQKLITEELNNLEEYINEASIELITKQEELKKRIDKVSKEIEKDLDYEFWSIIEDDLDKYFKTFPVYTFNPLLLIIYGMFENWLKKLCDLDGKRGFSKVKVKDLAGNNYIEKSRRYLTIVSELNLDHVNPEWQKITTIQKIRNCIAHHNSNIYKDKSKRLEEQVLYNLISTDNRIDLNQSTGDFSISKKDYLLDAIAVIKKYLFTVISKLESSKIVAKNTSMSFNNDKWGQEKTEKLLEGIIHGIKLLADNKIRADEFRDSDLKANIHSLFSSMSYNITKLYAFFCDGLWEPNDREILITKGEEGLNYLKKKYINKKHTDHS